MTQRYNELLNAINATDEFIVKIFLFALLIVVSYPVLNWCPAWMRRPAQSALLLFILGAFVFTTVYSGGQ